jgi:hypothetical protein
MNQALQRSLTNFQVLTPCARIGIYRYFDGWNSGTTLCQPCFARPARSFNAVVNLDGSPKSPGTQPNSTTPSNFQQRSVFGRFRQLLRRTIVRMPRLTAPRSCRQAHTSGWDPFRTQYDTTGFISRNQSYVPLPNNYEIGDGLNTAGFRWLRHNTGLDNLFSIGEDTGIRKQINVKIDQNFNSKNKANFNISYEACPFRRRLSGLSGNVQQSELPSPDCDHIGLHVDDFCLDLERSSFRLQRDGHKRYRAMEAYRFGRCHQGFAGRFEKW